MEDKFFYVYILICSDESCYIGLTSDLETRIKEHQAGRGCRFTANRLPVLCAFSEKFRTRTAAEDREFQLKTWSRKKKRALIENRLDLLRQLSKSRD